MAGIFPGCPAADVALSHHILPGKVLGPHTFLGAAGQGSRRVLLDSWWEPGPAHPSGKICGAVGPKAPCAGWSWERVKLHILHFPV